jgi:hypothetical protein
MKISKADLEIIIYEELQSVLNEKNLIKHLGKTVAPFALGASIASSMVDKPPQNVSQAASEASPEIDKEPKQAIQQKMELNLPKRYNILTKLGNTLEALNPVFSQSTPHGRAALAIAISIGGTETYGSLRNTKDFFTLMGGGKKVGNRMMGFAQFDTRYHRDKINTPQKYAKFMADIITGKRRMPNGKSSGDAVSALEKAIMDGQVKEEKDLISWLKANRFGGSNWQGIDDGWTRVPGLAKSLIDFVKGL